MANKPIPDNALTQMGERCAEIIRSYGGHVHEPDLRLIGEFAWALGAEIEMVLIPLDKELSAE